MLYIIYAKYNQFLYIYFIPIRNLSKGNVDYTWKSLIIAD